jgi:hypothetical protein
MTNTEFKGTYGPFFYFCFMGTVLLSSAYLPPQSWIREAMHADRVLIEAHETYPKQTYRNRCRIAAANGVLPLSIPVNKVDGRATKTKDIEISYDEDWQRLHRRSIEDAYTNSPFFLYFWDEFSVFFDKKHRFLLDLNMGIIQSVFNILGMNPDMELTEDFIKEPEEIKDLRYSISPKLLIDQDKFPRYRQVFEEKNGFEPDLSIIDLIFNEGPNSLDFIE